MWLKIVVSFGVASCVLTKLTGDNICQEEERYTVNVTKYFIRNATVRNYQWCLNVPPRCSVYSLKKLNESRIVEEEKVNLVDKCCPGFHEFENRCIPDICLECDHGYCDEENMQCRCYSGFSGDVCDKECEPMRWGVNCQFNCTCVRGACNPQTGYCICPSGWIGKRCELECPDGHYGEQCKQLCNCHQNGGGKCNGTTGECVKTIDDNDGDDDGDNENEQIKSDIEIVNNLLSKGLSDPELRKHPVLDKYYTFDYFTTQSSSPNVITTMKSTSYESSEGKGYLEEPSIYSTISSTSTSTVMVTEPEVDTTMSHTFSASSTSNDLFKQKQQVMKSDKIKIEQKGKVSDVLNHYLEEAKKAPEEEKWVNNDEEDLIQRDKKAPDENNLVFNVSTAAGITVAIILVAVAIVAVDRKKRMRRSKNGRNGKSGTSANAKCTTGIQTVSVYTKSIFHTPLPDPPPAFKNPVFTTTPVDTPASEVGTTTTFQTHVVCSMNFPSCTNNTTATESSNRDYLYDHPPSTGSYRPASIPEPPPEIDANGVVTAAVTTNEPVYDEIPCWGRPAPVTQLELQAYTMDTEQASLYMNTCAKTRF